MVFLQRKHDVNLHFSFTRSQFDELVLLEEENEIFPLLLAKKEQFDRDYFHGYCQMNDNSIPYNPQFHISKADTLRLMMERKSNLVIDDDDLLVRSSSPIEDGEIEDDLAGMSVNNDDVQQPQEPVVKMVVVMAVRSVVSTAPILAVMEFIGNFHLILLW
jgi:hypothetical protein